MSSMFNFGVSSKDIQKARQTAKRNRTSIACLRCKAAKMKCSDYRPCKQCTNVKISCEEADVRLNERIRETKLSDGVPEHEGSILRSHHQVTYQTTKELERHGQGYEEYDTMTQLQLSGSGAPMENYAGRNEHYGQNVGTARHLSIHIVQDRSPVYRRQNPVQFSSTANSNHHFGSIQLPALSSGPHLLPSILAAETALSSASQIVASNSIYQSNSLHLSARTDIPQLLPPLLASTTDLPFARPAILPPVAAILHAATLWAQTQPDALCQQAARSPSPRLQAFSQPPPHRF